MSKEIEELILRTCRKKTLNSSVFESLKKEIAKEFNCNIPSNILILSVYRDLIKKKKIKQNKKLEEILKKQKTRTLSGIASIAVFTRPYKCPGKCLYCPSQAKMPKSYLNNEPAVMRAILCDYSPAKQMRTRLEALNMCGHPTDKIELIVMGGTWSVLPKAYQKNFILNCFEAANRFKGKIKKEKGKSCKVKLKNNKLILEQRINEKAKHRIIGLTLETRPDYIDEEEIIRMRELGATRVELGVQSIYDEVLQFNNRGHTVETTIKATKLLKDAGFKINFHIMPNLPGGTRKKDLKMFDELFKNPDFQPDMLKIYPCVLTKSARKLYKLWKEKKYIPYSDETILNLLISIKKKIPKYARIMRLGRDIPANNIVAGNRVSNIRQVVREKMDKLKLECQCIRCREIRNLVKSYQLSVISKIKPKRIDYNASGGKEIFLSFENLKSNKLLAYLRLRIPSQYFNKQEHFIKVLDNAAIIRELKSLGQMVEINVKNKKAIQHKGLGKRLMKEAEKIAKIEFGLNKIAVIAGIGTRNYYRKLGYKLRDNYMMKKN